MLSGVTAPLETLLSLRGSPVVSPGSTRRPGRVLASSVSLVVLRLGAHRALGAGAGGQRLPLAADPLE